MARKSRRKTIFISLAQSNPSIAAEWDCEANKNLQDAFGHDLSTPDKVSSGSGYKVGWICNHGHRYEAAINARTAGSGCPFCSGKRAIPGETDLETTHPHISKYWHPTKNVGLVDRFGHDISTPDKVSKSATFEVWWYCEHGHSYPQRIADRVECTEHSCLICSNRLVQIGINDLATTHPCLAAEWNYAKNTIRPHEVVAGSRKTIHWKCQTCGYEWSARLDHRKKGIGCPVCTNQVIVTGINDLATHFPELVQEWDNELNAGLVDGKGRDISTPDKIGYHSGQKVYWRCNKNHSWMSTVDHRTGSHHTGCPTCNASKGEQAVRNVLTNLHINFKEQFVFYDRRFDSRSVLKDDFAILKNDTVVATIEYHGIQHYEVIDFSGHDYEQAEELFRKTLARDEVKTKYLREHNIPQLIIPYWEYDNIEQLVTDFVKEMNLLI